MYGGWERTCTDESCMLCARSKISRSHSIVVCAHAIVTRKGNIVNVTFCAQAKIFRVNVTTITVLRINAGHRNKINVFGAHALLLHSQGIIVACAQDTITCDRNTKARAHGLLV